LKKKILYITYDGLTDPLGQSQILPYLGGLSKLGYEFTILSFEKKQRYAKLQKTIRQITSEAGINWIPLWFTSRPPVISKMWDRIQMKRKAEALYREHRFDMVHCRGYISAEAGLYLKRKYGCKFFFDMRGFWADEKKDGGAWPQNNPLFRRVYRHYKKEESQFIQEASCIISLTHAGKREIVKWPSYDSATPLNVIPCCADMNVFTLRQNGEREEGRKALKLHNDELIISYLGSIGSWYMLDEMLELFSVIKAKYPKSRFLFITHSDPQRILSSLAKYKLKPSDLVITEATRLEVPLYVKASDVTISFIQAVYSKISSSPTKLAEVLAMGIPVIVNEGVGDVKETVEQSGGGIVINKFDRATYQMIADQLPQLINIKGAVVREKIEPVYSLRHGVELYSKAYSEVFNK
jgi:glycosyltransferase involved in cell wall biosynthesis